MFNFVAQRPTKQGTKYGLNLGQNVISSFPFCFRKPSSEPFTWPRLLKNFIGWTIFTQRHDVE